MTKTVYLTMPAARLARPAAPRAAPRRSTEDRDWAKLSLDSAEYRLRKAEEQARERAPASGLASNEAIAARARELLAEPGQTLTTIEAVDQARAEAGLQEPRKPTDADIAAKARELIAESGGRLTTGAAVDQARAEAATLASRGTSARNRQVWDRRQAQHGKVQETLADTALALERRLIAHARELIAASRRALGDDPIRARELAIRAREAMSAIYPLYGKKPDHGPAWRILQGVNGRPA